MNEYYSLATAFKTRKYLYYLAIESSRMLADFLCHDMQRLTLGYFDQLESKLSIEEYMRSNPLDDLVATYLDRWKPES